MMNSFWNWKLNIEILRNLFEGGNIFAIGRMENFCGFNGILYEKLTGIFSLVLIHGKMWLVKFFTIAICNTSSVWCKRKNPLFKIETINKLLISSYFTDITKYGFQQFSWTTTGTFECDYSSILNHFFFCCSIRMWRRLLVKKILPRIIMVLCHWFNQKKKSIGKSLLYVISMKVWRNKPYGFEVEYIRAVEKANNVSLLFVINQRLFKRLFALMKISANKWLNLLRSNISINWNFFRVFFFCH